MNPKFQLPKCLTSFRLKVIAIISMLIDHFAYIPFASVLSGSYAVKEGTVAYSGVKQSLLLWVVEHDCVLWALSDGMHWVGRLAFPLFCFLIVQGFLHTRSKAKYALRLAVFAVISEIPYDMAFSGCVLSFKNNNVFFTLLTGLLMIWGITAAMQRIDNLSCLKNKNGLRNGIYAGVVLVFALAASFLVSVAFDSSYGASGVLTILIIFLLQRHPVLALVLSTFVLAVLNFSFVQLFALPSALLVAMYNQQRGRPMKYFFYFVYPAHLLLFALIAVWLGNWMITA